MQRYHFNLKYGLHNRSKMLSDILLASCAPYPIYSVGVMPNCFLKSVAKWLCVEKPVM